MDIESFISLLGVENKRDGADYLIVCPFHNDHKPSLRVYGGKGHEGYHCYSCGSNGTWAHLYKEIKGCEWKEAYDVLGIDGDYKAESRPSPIRFDFVDPENPAFIKAINERYEQCLPLDSPEAKPAVEFLKKKHLLEQAKELGWKWDTGNFIQSKPRGALVIPYREDGKIVSCRLRTLEADGSISKPKSLKGTHARPFVLTRPDVTTLYICEGECLTPDTEVLTPEGWVRFDQYNGQDEVCQWDDGKLDFVKPLAFVKKDHINGRIFNFKTRDFSMSTTPKHRLPMIPTYKTKTNLVVKTAETIGTGSGYKVPRVGELSGDGLKLTDDMVRLAVAVSADFSERKSSWYGNFKKERKIKRIRELLKSVGIKYAEYERDKRGQIGFQIWEKPWYLSKLFDHTWLSKMTLAQRKVFIDEVALWDGNFVPNRNQSEYSTIEYSNAVFVQTVAHTCGMCSTIIERNASTNFLENAHWYKVSILWNKQYTSWDSAVRGLDITTYTGKVYCVTVPSSFFLIRHNGHITVTGNTDALSLYASGCSVVAVPGAGQKKCINTAVLYCELTGASTIVSCGDNDGPGQMMNELAQAASHALTTAHFMTLPPEALGGLNDINDAYVAGKLNLDNVTIESTIPGATPLTGWEAIYAKAQFSTKEELYALVSDECAKWADKYPEDCKFLCAMYADSMDELKKAWVTGTIEQQLRYELLKDTMKMLLAPAPPPVQQSMFINYD